MSILTRIFLCFLQQQVWFPSVTGTTQKMLVTENEGEQLKGAADYVPLSKKELYFKGVFLKSYYLNPVFCIADSFSNSFS